MHVCIYIYAYMCVYVYVRVCVYNREKRETYVKELAYVIEGAGKFKI